MNGTPKRKALGQGPLRAPARPGGRRSVTRRVDGGGGRRTASLEPNPFQPRSALEPARLQELAASIRESGIVQPILVRRRGRALPDHRGGAALAGRPAARPRHGARHRAGGARRAAPRARPRGEHPARGAHPARGGAGLPPAPRRVPPHPGGDRAAGGARPLHGGEHAPPAAPAPRAARARGEGRRSTPATPAPSSPSTAPRTRWRSGGRPRARGFPCARWSGGWRSSGPRARARGGGGTRTPGPPRSACARRSAPGCRSAGGAARGPSASPSRARRSSTGSSSSAPGGTRCG